MVSSRAAYPTLSFGLYSLYSISERYNLVTYVTKCPPLAAHPTLSYCGLFSLYSISDS